MNNELRFDITFDQQAWGWADIAITCKKQHVLATCSDVRDSLGDIIRGLANISSNNGKFEVICDSENHGIVVLGFSRTNSRFELTAKKTVNNLDIEDIRRHRVRLRYRGEWQQALPIIVSPFKKLLEQYNIDGYESKWSHAFPASEWKQLNVATH